MSWSSSTCESMYPGKSKTSSQVAWNRPQSPNSRVDDELIHKSQTAMTNTSDPVEKLRMTCLSRGSSGIVGLGRIFRRMIGDKGKQLDREEFFHGIKTVGLELTKEDAEEVFQEFDVDNTGYIDVDVFISHIRPPMSESRRAIVDKAFKKLDKTGAGSITVDEIRRVYSVASNGRYKSGEESEDVILKKFLVNFESEGSAEGEVTLDDFLNYYSGISVSVDNDCYFDLMMRQAYNL